MAKNEESPLPAFYAAWINDFLGASLPVEVRATCNDCQMIGARNVVCKSDVVFHPGTKCCTYMPDIPNFLAGAILADDTPEGASMREIFEQGALTRGTINPMGVFPTPEYAMAYRFSYRNFGQREGMRCPYYRADEGGLCGIWRHRNGRCSTWFCKHERGSVSVVFWKYLDRLLASVETSLAKWCLLKVGLGSRALMELIPASGDPVAGSKVVWGEWAGREREFFMECSRAVHSLNWKQVMGIVGPETHVQARLAKDAFLKWQILHIPERLKCGFWNVEAAAPGVVRVWTYSPFDPLELDAGLLNSLSLFNGEQPTGTVLRTMQADFGITLDPGLLQKLCDVRILVECE